MNFNFLFEKVETFLQNNVVSEGDLWLNIEHLTYLTLNGEIPLDDAERYTYILFKKLEELQVTSKLPAS
jgi:hypothetical protein